jgi:hypothetical protein
LAEAQRGKSIAEETRIAATEKARLAEQEKARLALEGAKQTEQAKAATQAKAAEEARVAAEKAKQVEQVKVLAAETVRVAAEKAAADKAATDKALEKVADAKQQKLQQVASLPSPDTPAPKPALSRAEMTRSLQVELRRVGCLTGAVDGEWTSASRRSLELFNKYAGSEACKPRRSRCDQDQARPHLPSIRATSSQA